MSRHDANHLWLKDLLEHLVANQKQLEWTADPEAMALISDTMLRDLELCRCLCESFRQSAGARRAV